MPPLWGGTGAAEEELQRKRWIQGLWGGDGPSGVTVSPTPPQSSPDDSTFPGGRALAGPGRRGLVRALGRIAALRALRAVLRRGSGIVLGGTGAAAAHRACGTDQKTCLLSRFIPSAPCVTDNP